MRTKQRAVAWNLMVLLLFLIGNVLTIVSLAAEILGLDLTPGFGMVQMFQLLVGITLLTLAGFLHIYRLRDPDTPRSLQADIGVRLAATGLVFAYVSGLSDLLGIGTHVNPRFERPYVGPLQLGGLVLGIVSITVGMLLYHTSRGSRETSALEFLLTADGKDEESPLAADEDAALAGDGVTGGLAGSSATVGSKGVAAKDVSEGG